MTSLEQVNNSNYCVLVLEIKREIYFTNFLPYLPPIMVGLVDKQQNFVFFHKDSLSILGQVFKVVCHTDKNLRIILAADPHIERRKLWEIGRMMVLLLTVVTRVVTQVVHNSLLLVVKHGMLFKATTLKRYFINVTTDDRELASFLQRKKNQLTHLFLVENIFKIF